MSVCIFFGHSESYGADEKTLAHTIEGLIQNGADTFYVGHQGGFDSMVRESLVKLHSVYPHVSFAVVLAYPPSEKTKCAVPDGRSIYPEGLEMGPPRFAIERRNKWMIEQGDVCVCYINHTWGGAYKFAKRAKNKGLAVINLGSATI